MSTARKRTASSTAAAGTAISRSKAVAPEAVAKSVKRAAAQAPAPDASTLFQGYGGVVAFSTGNVEALMLSGNIVARGVEDIGKAWLDFGQHSLHSGAALAKAITEVRTIQELVALQTDLARATLERLLSEGARLSELSARVANEAAAPLQARVSTAFGLLLKREAA